MEQIASAMSTIGKVTAQSIAANQNTQEAAEILRRLATEMDHPAAGCQVGRVYV